MCFFQIMQIMPVNHLNVVIIYTEKQQMGTIWPS